MHSTLSRAEWGKCNVHRENPKSSLLLPRKWNLTTLLDHVKPFFNVLPPCEEYSSNRRAYSHTELRQYVSIWLYSTVVTYRLSRLNWILKGKLKWREKNKHSHNRQSKCSQFCNLHVESLVWKLHSTPQLWINWLKFRL